MQKYKLKSASECLICRYFKKNTWHVKLSWFSCFVFPWDFDLFCICFKIFCCSCWIYIALMSSAVTEQDKAVLFPIAEARLGTQLSVGQNPRGAASGLLPPCPPLSPPWPPAKTGIASIGRAGLLRWTLQSCSKCTLSFNPLPSSAAIAQNPHGSSLMTVSLAC